MAERRSEPRICGPFPAIVLNADDYQESLGVRTVLDNFSASGCYLRLTHKVKKDDCLRLITQIARAVIMIRGVVIRVNPLKDGTYGLAVSISQHQFFSLEKFQG